MFSSVVQNAPGKEPDVDKYTFQTLHNQHFKK